MEKSLPSPSHAAYQRRAIPLRRRAILPALAALACFLVIVYGFAFGQGIDFWRAYTRDNLSVEAAAAVARCRSLRAKPGPPSDFAKRTQSDRYVPGTKPILIKNAKIWTGEKNGTEVITADILLDKGVIKGIGQTTRKVLSAFKDDIEVIDAKNAWVTPGIVDLHSHLGDASSPELDGASGDDNSLKGPILPWLRALDGLNTHDDAYALSISGGVTTALVLPGSANAIGGQGFTIKLRKTAERSPSSMLLEPPYQINSSFPDIDGPMRWRQMKHACGENPSRVYGNTRMDNVWAFREAYNKAREIKTAQDAYCTKVEEGRFEDIVQTPFPQDLQWEALVDILRGRVKVQIHCYETVDLDDIVRLSNEFQFPIAAFHHAHEAYLVPGLLKQAYGHPPAVAMFATNARYKREAYRGSEFAPRVLAQHGLKVVMKSDHPVLDSRYLLYEAQQAYLYGLPENLAIAAVTSTPAEIMGMSHRIGFVKEGYDADLVIWDSHPLALGATPIQVFIDGIPQIAEAYVTRKPEAFQRTPEVPNFDDEAKAAVEYEGLPPLEPKKSDAETVVFTNVKSVFTRSGSDVNEVYMAATTEDLRTVVVTNGKITAINEDALHFPANAHVVNLRGGSISPGLTTFGSPLGLVEIDAEDSTNDGLVFDPLVQRVPSIMGGDAALVRAVDGLQFGGRNALLAYRSGVLKAITAPVGARFYAGLSTTFATGALNKLDEDAVIQDVNAVHVTVRHFGSTPSVSTQIGTLRRLLLHPPNGDAGQWFKDVSEGKTTLVVDTDSADIIATLILLKREVEEKSGKKIQLTITGGLEAHLLAKELGEAQIGVIQIQARPFPATWERRRILPGHPLSEESSIQVLLKHNVTVGVGILEAWNARNARFDIGWLAIDAGGDISRAKAMAIGSTNIETLLGGKVGAAVAEDLVATEGGDLLDFGSKVIAVLSPRRESVNLL
ncbi:carbohydrate esterase family 9 protein [Phanerochaete sordida]|uniref:Carbohydrate esterase family 9 protein n=1 Tax=Phanerochaete sordida TaxID=48140 RepID=A0A9P3GG90_9APHY|nr:carbohydrate esterase family 9 protein [Phanerochaete sordida]